MRLGALERAALAWTTVAACGRLHFDPTDATPDGSIVVGTTARYVKASNPGAGDFFGAALALSADGNTLAVAAPKERSAATGIDGNQLDNSAIDAGAVYVFVRDGATWAQQAYVKSSNTGDGDEFGHAVALSADGNTLVITAHHEDSSATGTGGNQGDNAAVDSGAAYVFVRAGTTWSQQAYLKASNTGAGDSFGTRATLSADGNTLAISAFFEDSAATGVGGNQGDNSAMNSGAVYVFSRSGTTWSHEAYVKGANTEAEDLFGESISLSADGNLLVVGAPLEDSAATVVDGNQADNSMNEAGAAYVFERATGVWAQRAYLKPSNTKLINSTGSFFQFGWGVAVARDKSTLAVGARLEPSGATGVGGDQASTGAYGSGAVYLFARAPSWQQQAYIKASNTGMDDYFGEQVALTSDGIALVVAAPFEDSSATSVDGDDANDSATDAGAAYLFARSGSTWTQRAYVKATNTDGGDTLGSVAVSGDGKTLAFGAEGEDSSASGIDGAQADNSMIDSGAVYLFY